jgi:hypothetical protein
MRALSQALFFINVLRKCLFSQGLRNVGGAGVSGGGAAHAAQVRRKPRKKCCDSRCEVSAKRVFRQRKVRRARARCARIRG